jgi:hypothetical protein
MHYADAANHYIKEIDRRIVELQRLRAELDGQRAAPISGEDIAKREAQRRRVLEIARQALGAEH